MSHGGACRVTAGLDTIPTVTELFCDIFRIDSSCIQSCLIGYCQFNGDLETFHRVVAVHKLFIAMLALLKYASVLPVLTP